MAKAYYQTTKVVKVTDEKKVVVKAPGVAGPKGDAGTQILTGPGFPSNLIGKVGDFPELSKNVDIFLQYPTMSFFRYPMSKACPNKICLIKGNIEGNSICYCINEKVIYKIADYFTGIEDKIEKRTTCCIAE